MTLRRGLWLLSAAAALAGGLALFVAIQAPAAAAPAPVALSAIGGGGPISLAISLPASLLLVGLLVVMLQRTLFGLARMAPVSRSFVASRLDPNLSDPSPDGVNRLEFRERTHSNPTKD